MNTRLLCLLIAAIALTLLPSCVEPPPGSESAIWQRPPRYGHGGTDLPKPANNKKKDLDASNPRGNERGSGRFGYSGDDEEAPVDQSSNVDEAPRDRDRDMIAEEKPAEEKSVPEKKSGPPSVGEMPFAKGVPGKPLSVTLPSPHSNLGEVSIEQYEGGKPTGKPLPPGTPVEIPDPGNPGKKIYFKVP